ncbi:MAG: amidotransferase [Bacteroidetes bacterium]|nr:amidotransferase [Bacteroidota bacterium]
MAKIHAFFHVPFEGLGSISEWISTNNHSLTSTNWWERSYQNEPFDVLIIMGGPMGVYDESELSWLKEEKEIIKSAIDAGKIVLGICLGSQLIAEVCGAKVYPNHQKEIGWFPISGTPEFDGLTVFHWHGDTFDLPNGAELVASSPACKHQAFWIGDTILGLQFHLEVREEDVKRMIEHEGHELEVADFVQSADEILENQRYFQTNKAILFELLDRLVK